MAAAFDMSQGIEALKGMEIPPSLAFLGVYGLTLGAALYAKARHADPHPILNAEHEHTKALAYAISRLISTAAAAASTDTDNFKQDLKRILEKLARDVAQFRR